MGIKHRPEEKGREKRKETGKKEGDKRRRKKRRKTRVGREIEDAPWRRRRLNRGEERCGVSSLPRVLVRPFANTRARKKKPYREVGRP